MSSEPEPPDDFAKARLCENEQCCADGRPMTCADDFMSWVPAGECGAADVCIAGVCTELPEDHGRSCHEEAPCKPPLDCFGGQCLTHPPASAGGSCLTDEECQPPLFCNGIGQCSTGDVSDCLADSDCGWITPVCDPIARMCSSGAVGAACLPGYGCRDALRCGPAGTCQTGNEGNSCTSHDQCADNSPICFRGTCQDGEGGDHCDSDQDCSPNTPRCLSGLCTAEGEGAP